MNEINTFKQVIHGMGGTKEVYFVNIDDFIKNYLQPMQIKLLKEVRDSFVEGQLDITEQLMVDLERIVKMSKS